MLELSIHAYQNILFVYVIDKSCGDVDNDLLRGTAPQTGCIVCGVIMDHLVFVGSTYNSSIDVSGRDLFEVSKRTKTECSAIGVAKQRERYCAVGVRSERVVVRATIAGDEGCDVVYVHAERKTYDEITYRLTACVYLDFPELVLLFADSHIHGVCSFEACRQLKNSLLAGEGSHVKFFIVDV